MAVLILQFKKSHGFRSFKRNKIVLSKFKSSLLAVMDRISLVLDLSREWLRADGVPLMCRWKFVMRCVGVYLGFGIVLREMDSL